MVHPLRLASLLLASLSPMLDNKMEAKMQNVSEAAFLHGSIGIRASSLKRVGMNTYSQL